MAGMLINRKATKAFILAKCESMRPWSKFNRVKGDVFEKLDARLRAMIVEEVRSHPSVGKTFTLG